MMGVFLLAMLLFSSQLLNAQADNEIQVYASPTIQHKWTIFELHSNFTVRGNKFLTDPAAARWQNETLEITHALGKTLNWASTHSPHFRLGATSSTWAIKSGQG